MVQDLVKEFTRYKENPTLDVSRTNPVFRTVVHDIEEVYLPNCNCVCVISNSCGRKLVKSSPLCTMTFRRCVGFYCILVQNKTSFVQEDDNRTQPSILSLDTFHRQMTVFSRSLVRLSVESLGLSGWQFSDLSPVELVTSYVDRTASERSPRRVGLPNRQYPTDSPSGLTQSDGHQRSSTVSPDCPQIPPLNFTALAVEETSLTEQSPSASDYPSSSRSTSAVSGLGSSGTASTSPPASFLEIESQQPNRPSIIVNDVASGSQSLRRSSLIVPETVWDPGRSLKNIKPETLESVIQYLLIHSAGRLRPVLRLRD